MPKILPTLRVSIVLPNWNGRELLRKNLPEVLAAAPGAQVIVTDDASSDASIDMLAREFPDVTVVANSRRQGFAGNVNSGVAQATGDIVVLLNTDVRPEKGFLAPIIKDFADADLFAVGCLEKSYEGKHIVERGRGIARWEKGYFIHDRGEVNRSDTAWVSGGSSAFRKSMWEKLGGMDTLYNPFYWEDIDLSYRALKSGFTIQFERKSVVGHFHEEGKIKTSFSATDVKRIAYRNQFIFLWKNMSDIRLWLDHIFWTPVRLMQAIISGDFLMPLGYVLAIGKLPAILSRRMRESRLWRKKDTELFSTS